MLTKETLVRFEEREKNEKYVISHYKDLKKKYPDMWVAVESQQIVATGKDYRSLITKLKKTYSNKFCGIAVEYIAKKDVPMILSLG